MTLGRGPLRPGPAPTGGPLIDTFGRVHTDLRLSVTDRCNLRCTYYMPEEGVEWLPRADLLTVAELERTDGGGEIGVIASVTNAFCGTCNRLRLTADGAIRNCLFGSDERSARDVIRAGGSDDDLAGLFRAAVWAKLPGHGVNDPSFVQPDRPMSRIGG